MAEINDLISTAFLTGKVVLTECIGAMSDEDRSRVIDAVRAFNVFAYDSEPHGEHDLGIAQLEAFRPSTGRSTITIRAPVLEPQSRRSESDAPRADHFAGGGVL